MVTATYFSAALAGASAGGLHAVTGPDHLAALLPMTVGQRWWTAMQVGGVWGVGHGLGASSMGALAWWLKGLVNIEAMSEYMEALVGVTLVIIGVVGLRKVAVWKDPKGSEDGQGVDIDLEGLTQDGPARQLHQRHGHGDEGLNKTPYSQNQGSGATTEKNFSIVSFLWPGSHTHSHGYHVGMGKKAMLITGIVHGFSGTGHLLGVIPALMLSKGLAAAYLMAFCLGTCFAMALFTGAVGEASVKIGKSLRRPDLPRLLSTYSSVVALVVGCIWIFNSTLNVFMAPTSTAVTFTDSVEAALHADNRNH